MLSVSLTLKASLLQMFAQSGTSCGLMNNNGNFKTCGGGNATTFPQRTIYDNLRENNRSFALYTNASGVFNDLIMDGVARHKDMFHNYSHFFAAAAAGSLPNFAFVTPPSGWSDHPCQDIRHGERLVKDLYESLRSGLGAHVPSPPCLTYWPSGGMQV